MSTTLLNNVDLWTSAVRHKSTAGRGSNRKIELAGINKLRELILELAVRGKLVPQNPDDEPASELLKRIEAEKAQLIKDGKLKKQKPLPAVSDDEKPFELPQGWVYGRLGSLTEMFNGRAFKSSEWVSTGLPIVRIQNLNDETAPHNYFDGELDEKNFIDNGTFLISWSGTPGTSFGAFIWNRGPAALNQHINKCCFFSEDIDLPFMRLAVSGKMNDFIGSAKGGVGLKHVTKGVLENAVLALPPLAEQQRIVAKVNELMALCDQLEQQSEHQLDAHQQLTETLLSTLTDAADAQELNDNWQRLAQHFDLLFSGPMGAWAIDRLKDTILQLAVMGKLVPQNPADEPAAELLKRIDAEKARLVKEGKIKKQKPLPPVSDDEKPFELPQGWEWSRLFTLGLTSTGKTPSTSQLHFFDGEIPFIGPGQISSSGNISKPEKYLSELGMLESTEALPNDIITVCIGGSIGKSAVVTFRMAFNQQINLIRPLIVNHHYIFQAVSTEKFNKMIVESSSGSATPIINRSKWESLPVPVPPLAEQRRIVAKVDELFALCDQLKERLQDASDTQLNLTDAIVEQALN